MDYNKYEAIRIERGLDDAEVARRVGFCQTNLSRVKRNPGATLRADNLLKIANLLDCKVSELLSDKEL